MLKPLMEIKEDISNSIEEGEGMCEFIYIWEYFGTDYIYVSSINL